MTPTQALIIGVVVVAALGLFWAPTSFMAANLRTGFQIGLGIVAALLLIYFLTGSSIKIRADIAPQRPPQRLAQASGSP